MYVLCVAIENNMAQARKSSDSRRPELGPIGAAHMNEWLRVFLIGFFSVMAIGSAYGIGYCFGIIRGIKLGMREPRTAEGRKG
jgi:hypothetical protein